MFTSLVVALDLEASGDRALPVVRALARLADVAVELVTVSSPLVAEDIDSFELGRRATASGWPAHAYIVLHGDDVARVLVDHVRGRDGSLLVMATSAKRPLVGRLGGSVSTRVLALTDRPVLLVGPMVSPRLRIARPTLVVGVGPMEHAGVAVSTIASWTQTFPGDDPWVVEVVPTAGGPADPADSGRGGAPPAVRRAARRRRGAGVLAGASRRRTRLLVGGLRRARRRPDPRRHERPLDRWPAPLAQRDPRTRAPLDPPGARRAGRRRRRHRRTALPPRPPPRPATSRWRPTIRAAIEELPVATCWELVRTRRVGRLAVNVDGRARIFPINFVVDGQTIVFRTAPGTKLSAARGADVEFEVDHYDASTGRAWSVIVAGRATEVTRADEWEHVHDLLLFPWHLAPKPFFVRIDPEAVTGRRFRAVYAGADDDDTGPPATAEDDAAGS